MSESPVRPVTPREAASVILARDASAGLEVLLLERHPDSRFSPGAFAFPGGRVSEHQAVATLLAAARGREIRPVRPRVVRDAGGERILLPEDPGWF